MIVTHSINRIQWKVTCMSYYFEWKYICHPKDDFLFLKLLDIWSPLNRVKIFFWMSVVSPTCISFKALKSNYHTFGYLMLSWHNIEVIDHFLICFCGFPHFEENECIYSRKNSVFNQETFQLLLFYFWLVLRKILFSFELVLWYYLFGNDLLFWYSLLFPLDIEQFQYYLWHMQYEEEFFRNYSLLQY